MKIIDVLQKTEYDENEIIWIFCVEDVPQKYIDTAYKIDEEYGYKYFKGSGLEIECITDNDGNLVGNYEVHLMYYFDDYETIEILNNDKEAIKCIKDFVQNIGNKLPYSDYLGQSEYADLIADIINNNIKG